MAHGWHCGPDSAHKGTTIMPDPVHGTCAGWSGNTQHIALMWDWSRIHATHGTYSMQPKAHAAVDLSFGSLACGAGRM